MTNTIRKRYEAEKPIGVYSLSNCFGILFFEPGEEDKYNKNCDLIVAYSNGISAEGYHKHKIYHSPAGRSYIRKGGIRIYLDEVMRVF